MAEPSDFPERVRRCTARLPVAGADALAALFDLTSQRLVRFAAAITRHQHDAEDAVQAAITRLATNPQRLAAVACPWAYLLRVVRNEVFAAARRQQRCSPGLHVDDLVTYCPVDEAEREESHRAVWAALRSLPADQAEVVVLKIWEQMTFAQIAEVLEASPNTVASRYKYAIGKLTKQLQSQGREVHRD